jgi:hypothetical protein
LTPPQRCCTIVLVSDTTTFITVEDTYSGAFEDYMESLGCPRWEEPQMCECEQDWNCPLHQNRRGTWIETRYEGDPEAEYERRMEAQADAWAEARFEAWDVTGYR